MAGITIRKPEERVKLKLGMRAAANAQSMEEEVRQIPRSMPDQVPIHTDQNMDSVAGFRFSMTTASSSDCFQETSSANQVQQQNFNLQQIQNIRVSR